MKLEDQVCSFTQAQKLVALGLDVCSYFLWQKNDNLPAIVVSEEQNGPKNSSCYPALTVAELGVLLPAEISVDDEDLYLQSTIGNRKGEFHYLWFQFGVDNAEWDLFPAIEQDTEALARADALIWLIENNYLNPAELKL